MVVPRNHCYVPHRRDEPGTNVDETAAEHLLGVMDGVQRTVSRLPELVARHADLPTSRMAALGAIARGGTMVSDVAAATMLSVSAASRTVDVLVDDGLVHRAQDPDNRRAVVLTLTEEGVALSEELRAYVLAEFLEPVAADLGAVRTREVADALQDLVAAIARRLDEVAG